jgi:hypothetical protein
VKVRGTASSVAEKYQQLARDAHTSGFTSSAEAPPICSSWGHRSEVAGRTHSPQYITMHVLRAPRDRPGRRAPQSRDELAPLHASLPKESDSLALRLLSLSVSSLANGEISQKFCKAPLSATPGAVQQGSRKRSEISVAGKNCQAGDVKLGSWSANLTWACYFL